MADVYTGEIAGIVHLEEFPPDAELEDLISTVDWDSLWNSVFPADTADTPNNTSKGKLTPDNQRDNQEVSLVKKYPEPGSNRHGSESTGV